MLSKKCDLEDKMWIRLNGVVSLLLALASKMHLLHLLFALEALTEKFNEVLLFFSY